jgi:hypothetical protein
MNVFVREVQASVGSVQTADVLELAAELCVQKAAANILSDIATMYTKDEQASAIAEGLDLKTMSELVANAQTQWDHRASPVVLNGYQGICARSLGALIDSPHATLGGESLPYIPLEQCVRSRLRGPGIYNTGQWCDRIFTLFNWPRANAITADPYPGVRAWSEKPYRQFTRQIYKIIERELGVAEAEDFITVRVPRVASRALLIIPAVERTTFFQYFDKGAVRKLPTVKYWIPQFDTPANRDQYANHVSGSTVDLALAREYKDRLIFNLRV